ncbi:MAG: phosphotransferase [Candidatus Nanoarchaeia archaeon]
MIKEKLEKEFLKRISYTGNIENISLKICDIYNLGNFVSNKIVLTGYEDFNYILKTSKGSFFVKVFSDFRSLKDCKRYVDIMNCAYGAHISTPKLYASNQGHLSIIKDGKKTLRMCLIEYIEGCDLYVLKKLLNRKEIKFLARQAALINSMNIKPSFIYDSWAIPNFSEEYRIKGKYLSSQDRAIMEPLLEEFRKINIASLPKAFVHGDILITNVMKDKKGKLWIVDFAASNYSPRIQEMAILACNLLYNENDKKLTESNLALAIREYEKILKFTAKEKKALTTYIKLAHAMHVLLSSYQKKVLKNKTAENEYWLYQGRTGLRQILE